MRGLFLLPALAACAPVEGPAIAPEQDAQLVVLLFDHARSIEANLARTFACVSLRQGGQDVDPPGFIVQHLAERWSVPVIAGSHCSVGGDGDVVIAPGVRGEGKWLRVANLECRDENHCTADVSYYVANLGAGGRTVVIDRAGSDWRITPSGPMWIS